LSVFVRYFYFVILFILLLFVSDVQRELKNVESENPNVHVISKIISNLFIGKEADANSRVMVFVHARATCRALADFLNDELEKIHVKASPLLGKETRGTDKG
jgi:ERCC4-related helicase